MQTRTCIGALKSIIMFFHLFIAMEYAFTLFNIVFSLLIARLMRLAIISSFPRDYVISLCGVVVKCSRVESKVPRSNPTMLFIPSFFFSPFFVLLFSINI